MGIDSVHEINAFDIDGLKKLIKEEVAKDEISVIITKSPCVLLKTTKVTGVCRAIPEKCKKCGMCLKPGCPAVIKMMLIFFDTEHQSLKTSARNVKTQTWMRI
nr:MAG TPA: Indolepyruvate ferredoxin oxidoreductase [Caudoviricetes sp.]